MVPTGVLGSHDSQPPAARVPASPPLVGRPVDFAGAVGGPFVVQWIAQPTTVTAEAPLTLTLRVIGKGDLAAMPRPALGKLAAFKSFAIEDLDDRLIAGNPPRREFRYRVRPRSASVKEIPRFKFVYFNPRIIPTIRGFQTTYADALPLTVKPKPAATATPPEVPSWMLTPPATDELLGRPRKTWEVWLDRVRESIGQRDSETSAFGKWLLVAEALLLPPLVCGVGMAIWRRVYPDAARLAAGRRSRSAANALRGIDRAGSDRPDLIAAAMISYLHDRIGLPTAASTPSEMATSLADNDCPALLIAMTVAVLNRCDAVRFGPGSADDDALAADAAKVVVDWEAVWAAPGC
jgi:hypothetical protein